MIKRNKKVFLCSNRNTEFKKDITTQIIKACNLKEQDYLLYSGDEGEQQGINTEDWKNKRLIMATPTIIYGCDSSYKFNVVGFYFRGNHFDAMDIYQQISRERNPQSINLYLANNKETPFKTLQDAEKYGKSSMNVRISNRFLTDYIEPLTSLLFYEDFRKSHHLNIRHHLIDLLKQKGYHKFNHILDKHRTHYITTKQDYINQQIREYNNGDIDQKKKQEIYKRLGYFNLEPTEELANITKQSKILNNKYNTIVNNLMEIFIDKNKFNKLINYIRFKNPKSDLIKDGKQIKPSCYDIIDRIIRKVNYKIGILLEIKERLNLEDGKELDSINKDNYNDTYEYFNTDWFKNFKKAFRDRSKRPYKNTKIELVALYMRKLRNVLGADVIKSKNQNVSITPEEGEQLRYSIGVWNMELVEKYKYIIDFRDTIQGILYKCNILPDEVLKD